MIFRFRLFARYAVWLWPISCFAQPPSLLQVLVHPISQTQDNIRFVLQNAKTASISEVRFHFLSGEDCYSGYLQGYRVAAADSSFLLAQNHVFELTGTGLYQTASTALNADELSQVQSVLLRFVDRDHGQRYQQFARFTGSCQDQDINCCIPIRCSVNAGVCTAKYGLSESQAITWL